MSYKIVSKYIKDLSYKIPNAKSYYLLEKNIKDYRVKIDVTSKRINESILEIDTNLLDGSEENSVDVKLLINEGPRVYVNKINIAGNTRTVDKVIRREVKLAEGDPYNKYSINYSKDSIRALNYFKQVEINQVRTKMFSIK